MIVKDEEDVLERALLSAKPWIQTWVIVDTGSTDGTKDVIRRCLGDISGLLFDRPWINFGHNRTEALELCRGQMDWAIMLDADDNLAGTVPPAELWLRTDFDGFLMKIHHGDIVHKRPQIFRVAADWCYKGALHEHAICRGTDQSKLAELPAESYMVTRCEGARSKDPQKYLKDALLLEMEYRQNPLDSRTVFYLAQSYRDAGRKQESIAYYRKHLDLSGTWIQERYLSLVNLIGMVEDFDEQLRLGWMAVELCPERLEAQYSVLRNRRVAGQSTRIQQIYALGSVTANRKVTEGHLFVNPSIYSWGMDDELSVVAFAAGHYRESYEASMRTALNAPAAEMREHALNNARKALERCS
jgi:glycosyltransferase involved in cell wall biosynthesis